MLSKGIIRRLSAPQSQSIRPHQNALRISLTSSRLPTTERWAYTRRESALNALKQIVNSGGRLAGVVPAMVNFRKHAYYGYGESGCYPGNTKKYYAS